MDYKIKILIFFFFLVICNLSVLATDSGGNWQDVLDLLNNKRTDVGKEPITVPNPEDIDMNGVLAIRQGTVNILGDYGFTGLADALNCAGYAQDTWSEGFDCKNEIENILNLMKIEIVNLPSYKAYGEGRHKRRRPDGTISEWSQPYPYPHPAIAGIYGLKFQWYYPDAPIYFKIGNYIIFPYFDTSLEEERIIGKAYLIVNMFYHLLNGGEEKNMEIYEGTWEYPSFSWDDYGSLLGVITEQGERSIEINPNIINTEGYTTFTILCSNHFSTPGSDGVCTLSPEGNPWPACEELKWSEFVGLYDYYPKIKYAYHTCNEKVPTASFIYSPENPLVKEEITFDASSSSDSDGTIVSYEWDFGDENIGEGIQITHPYAKAGNYTVTLTVTDNDGLKDSLSKVITVKSPPVASFTYSPEGPVVCEKRIFNASSSYDPDGEIVSYNWDFGDRNTAKGEMVTYAYTKDGEYTVTLTITDNDGLVNSTSKVIEVGIAKLCLLFVPMGAVPNFDSIVNSQTNKFISETNLASCSDRVIKKKLKQSFQGSYCGRSCGLSSLRSFASNLVDDINIYDVVVGIAPGICPNRVAGCSNGGNTVWISPDRDNIVLAHEFGHLSKFGDFEDQYCSNPAGSSDPRCNDGGEWWMFGFIPMPPTDVNYLDANLGCDPHIGNCCSNCSKGNDPFDPNNDYFVCCEGNINLQGGRSIMSYVDAPGPRNFDAREKRILNSKNKLKCPSDIVKKKMVSKISYSEKPTLLLNIELILYQNDSVSEYDISLIEGEESYYTQPGDMYTIKIEDEENNVLWNNSFNVYFDYNGPVESGVDYSNISFEDFLLTFKIPYDEKMKELKVFHNNNLIFSKTLELSVWVLKGSVTDTNGLLIPNASIHLSGPSYNYDETDENGNYELKGFKSGEYTLHVYPPHDSNLIDFETEINITAGEVIYLNITLEKILETNITLKEGWNLISLPVKPLDNQLTMVLIGIEGSYSHVFTYNSPNKEWRSYSTERPDFLNTLQTLDESVGYWLNMVEADNLTVKGLPTDTTIFNLKQGWNLISYPALTEQPVTIALLDVNGTYTSIFTFIDDSWSSYSPEKPEFLNTLQTIMPGYGYWVKVSENTTWVFDGTGYKKY